MLTVERGPRAGARTARARSPPRVPRPDRTPWAARWPRTSRPTSISRRSTRRWSTATPSARSDLAAGRPAAGDRRDDPGGQTPTRPLGPREAAVIMTGAPLPAGADAVVMHRADAGATGGAVVDRRPDVRPGRNRLARGRDLRAGESSCSPRATPDAPRPLGLLASVGRTAGPGDPAAAGGDRARRATSWSNPARSPGPGQIRNSNAVMLQALALAAGRRAPRRSPIAPDEPRRLCDDPRARARGRRPARSPAASRPGSATSCPAALGAAGGRARSSTRSASSRASRSGSASGPRRGGRPGHAGLRPAGQSGQRPGRVPAVRPPGARRPGRAARRRRRRAVGAPAQPRRSSTAATGRPIIPRGWSAAATPPGGDRAAGLGGLGRPADGGPGRRLRRLPRRATGITRQVKLSVSCRSR